ncbi:hypothetical protein TNCV_1602621 [Trichonephila clavipes]|nr:hypothetical protein TNCV_1602621 [Trichonephila clavipes]
MVNLGDKSFSPTNLGRVDEEMVPPGREVSQTYHLCNSCPNTPLNPYHVFDCPEILRSLALLGEFPPFSRKRLHSNSIGEIASACCQLTVFFDFPWTSQNTFTNK